MELHGEFCEARDRKLVCSVSVTEDELQVRRLTCSPAARHELVLRLRDCVGCRAYRPDSSADPAAYLAVYLYPPRRRWRREARVRLELCFRLATLMKPEDNLEEARRWSRAILERSERSQEARGGPWTTRRVLILLNPHSGKGQSLSFYNHHIRRMLIEAGVSHKLLETERQDHARELVKKLDLSHWDALVVLSGDGLLFEVINGLMERSDWQLAVRTPLGILPGGSGNALAASTHHYTGASPVFGKDLLVSCGFLLCKGLVSPMDLVSVQLGSGSRLFSFLSLAWGIVADVDVESERYRPLGPARFTVGMLARLASLRVYRGHLAYLPAARDHDTEEDPRNLDPCHSDASPGPRWTERPKSHGLDDLPPLSQPLTPDWVAVPEKDFVLVLAMYQSHLAEDLLAAPAAAPDDGLIHLSYVTAGISRAALLKLFLAMETGTHLDSSCPHLVHTTVRAVRLEPLSPRGTITVDGELVEYGPVQAQVHRGLARLIS